MADELPILGVPISEASRILGCKDTKTKQLIKTERLETFTIDHRRLVYYPRIVRLVEEQRKNPGDPRRNDAVAKAGERRKAGAAP
jgi:hypothetical protein